MLIIMGTIAVLVILRLGFNVPVFNLIGKSVRMIFSELKAS